MSWHHNTSAETYRLLLLSVSWCLIQLRTRSLSDTTQRLRTCVQSCKALSPTSLQ